MKKIGIIFSSYEFAKNLKLELLKELLSMNYQITLLMPFHEKNIIFKQMGCSVINTDIQRRGLNIFNDLKYVKTLKSIMKKEKFDKVITYTIKCNIYGGYAAKKLKIPYYVNITGLGTAFQKKILKHLAILMYKYSLSKTKKAFFENEDNKNTFLRHKILKENKCFVINGAGVNVNNYSYHDLEEKEKKEFLFIGRLMKEKGIEELLYVMNYCVNHKVNAKFSIVGFYEDDYQEKIKEFVDKKVLDYYGFQDDIKPFLKNCTCVLLPSYHEGMNNGLLEGAACGKVLLASNIHGCKEIVIDKVTGFTFEPKNPQDTLEKVLKICSMNYMELNEMGKNARLHVEKNFDRSKVNAKFISIFEEK